MKRFIQNILAFAFFMSFAAIHTAHAVLLSPNSSAALPGTTVAAEPQLAGFIIEDNLQNFSMNIGGGQLVTGQIQSRVVRSDVDGTLDFYWRVFNDPNSAGDIAFFRFGDFIAPEYDANWRIDGLGDVAPVSAYRFDSPLESYVNFDFTHTDNTGAQHGIMPGESSMFMLMDTTAVYYAETAKMDIADFGTIHASNSLNTFSPSSVSEPSIVSLMLLSLLIMWSASRRKL